MISKFLRGGLSCFLGAALGCGTMFSGRSQEVRVTSVPTDAEITLYRIDGERIAGPSRTNGDPLNIPRPRGFVPYLSVVSGEGRCPTYAMTKVTETPGYMAGVVLLAFPLIQLVGLAMVSVDENRGGCCSVEPIVVELEADETCE